MEIPRGHTGCPELKLRLGTTREEVFAAHLQLLTGRPVDFFQRDENGELPSDKPPGYVRQYYGILAPADVIRQAWEATPDEATIKREQAENERQAQDMISLCPRSERIAPNDGRPDELYVRCGLDCLQGTLF